MGNMFRRLGLGVGNTNAACKSDVSLPHFHNPPVTHFTFLARCLSRASCDGYTRCIIVSVADRLPASLTLSF